MLPSREVRAIAERCVLIGVRSAGGETLAKEFEIPSGGSWIVILDGKGETLDRWAGDSAGSGCTKETAGTFPELVARKIAGGLKRTESLEELERRWEKDRSDGAALDVLAGRLEEAGRIPKLRALCGKMASDASLPAAVRAEGRIRGFVARSRDSSAFEPGESSDRFIREGEDLLAELAAHGKARQVVSALLEVGYGNSFDVPSKLAAARARLEARAGDAPPLRERIAELVRLGDGEIRRRREELREVKAEDEEGFGWLFAYLGDAERTVRFFAKPPYDAIPQFRQWVREAREKLAKDRK